ncbi:MAG: diguanylate cyclase [bacterium]|nr:diguanylate cyclase [bacterium]
MEEKTLMNYESKGFQPNILVVDDTRDNLRLLSNILSEKGYQVRPVSQGSRAISAAQSKVPDLILLDIMMPEMNGYQVCQALKADERTCDVPIIFISALNETFDKVKGFSMGGVDYITKPFQTEEVLARVETHLSLRNMQERLKAHNHRLALLNRMSYELQMCRTEEESYQVLSRICEQLFPGIPGALLILDTEQASLESVASWGTRSADVQPLGIDELDMVYNDGSRSIDHPEAGRISSRIGYSPDHTVLYAPIGTGDELLAMLAFYLAEGEESEFQINDWEESAQSEHLLMIQLAEHYALALVNLKLRETLRQESIRDPLTNLYNRRHMEAALSREAYRVKRRGTSIAIIMCDVDHFKNFNDTYGHEAGDVVLRELGKLMQKSIREEDLACRYGGEEFLLIFSDITLDAAKERVEEFLQKVRAHKISYQVTHFRITISAGIALFPEHGPTIQDTVGAADAALYQAKNGGRNQAVLALPG